MSVQPFRSAFSPISLTANATDLISYIGTDGTAAEADCESVTSNLTLLGENNTVTWYVVDSNVSTSTLITVSGETNLILKDGCTLTAAKGIRVKNDATFRIFGQSAQNGLLEVTAPNENQAGIGANSNNEYGTIEIYGGTIHAKGGKQSAGIGGARKKSGTAILIANGTVVAEGGTNAAGIGGGNVGSGGNITITGGTITTTGGRNGAGIGGGQTGNGGNITITGGTVYAYAGEADADQNKGGAGIGSGKNNETDKYETIGGSITITGGSIVAVGSAQSAGIGGGYGGGSGSIEITGGEITAIGQDGCDSIGDGADPTVTEGSIAIRNTIINGVYYDENGNPVGDTVYSEITAPDFVTVRCDDIKTIGEKNYYPADSTVSLTAADGYYLENVSVVSGEESLALTETEDGFTFTMPEGNVTITADGVKVYTITAPDSVTVACDDVKTVGEQKLYPAGSTVTLTAAEGWFAETFSAVSGEESLALTETEDGFTFTMPEGNVTITADSVKVYAITAPDSVTVACDDVKTIGEQKLYPAGSTVTLTAAEGWFAETISAVSGEEALALTETEDGFTFTMPEGNVTITADGVKVYTITAPDSVTVACDDVKTVGEQKLYPAGSTVTLTAAEGWSLVNVEAVSGEEALALTETENGFTFTMPEGNVTVSAERKRSSQTASENTSQDIR